MCSHLNRLHWGDSNEYTQYSIFNINTKMTLNYPKSAAMRFSQGTQERVRNSRGKRVISVRAIEVLLFVGLRIQFKAKIVDPAEAAQYFCLKQIFYQYLWIKSFQCK